MTLSTGPTLNFIEDHMFAWSGLQDLTGGGTTLLDFISPNNFYSVVTNVSFDYSGCSIGDAISWTISGNGDAWNKYVKANSKKPRFRYRNGKLNLKKMAVAFRKTPAGRKKRR
jgi:hypothetical protein